MNVGPKFSLRFLSGKCQGSEYSLDELRNVLVGRSSDADMVLLEGLVSRLHARFTIDEDVLQVEDLSSTNGTFVNGERVSQRALKEGDRVLIGTSILKVVAYRSGAEEPVFDESSESSAGAPTRNSYDLRGTLEDATVLELVEMYGVPERQAVLELKTPAGLATLTLSGGRVQACTLESLPRAASPAKRLFRFLSILTADFRVRPYEEPARLEDSSVAELLVEGRHLVDEFSLLMSRLPEPDQSLALAKPLVGKLSDLDEHELDLFQLAHNVGKLQTIFDQCEETDVEAARRLLTLLDGGYLRRL